MATYGEDRVVSIEDAAVVQSAISSRAFPNGVPKESFSAHLQSAADRNKMFHNNPEEQLSLKEVLANHPPLLEEVKAFQEAITSGEVLSPVLTDIQYAFTRIHQTGSVLGKGEEDPHAIDTALKQAHQVPAYGEHQEPLFYKPQA